MNELDQGHLTTNSLSSMSSSIGYGETTKFGGLIDQSYYKRARNLLYNLTQYIFDISPSYNAMHNVVSMFRIFQIIGPCFCLSYTQLWDDNNKITMVFKVLSILFHLVPPDYRDDSQIIVLVLYFIIGFFFFLFLIGSAFYFKVNAKLPKIVPKMLTILIGSAGFLFHPIAMTFMFELISSLITDPSQPQVGGKIICILFSIVCLIGYSWYVIIIECVSLDFRPISLQTTLFQSQNIMYMLPIITTALTSLGTTLPKIGGVVLILLAGLVYITGCLLTFYDGGMIRSGFRSAFMTVTAFGGVFCVLNAVLLILGQMINATIIFIMVAVGLIFCFLSMFIVSRKTVKQLQMLDFLSDDPNIFDNIKSSQTIIQLVITGFSKSHPYCLTFDIFKHATEKYPKDIKLWVLYLKFIAIYPEQSQMLAIIIQHMINNRIKGSVSKNIIAQAATLTRQRDTNLSPILKNKLSQLSKKVMNTKRKMRHIWDLVIQGSLNEMESSISRACEAVEQCQAEFSHVLHQYSNNRFIARSYTRFVHEILADHQLAFEWYEKVRMLQRGVQTAADRAHEVGLIAYPNLPPSLSDGIQVANGMNTTTETDLSLTAEPFDIDEDANASLIEQTSTITEAIKVMVIPAIRCTNICRLILLVLFFFAPITVLAIYLPILTSDLLEPCNFLYSMSFLRCVTFQTAVISHRYVLESSPGAILNRVIRADRAPPSALGSSFEPTVQLSFVIKTALQEVQTLTTFSSYKKGDQTMDKARNAIFGDNMPYLSYICYGNRNQMLLSLQVGIMDSLSQLTHLLEKQVVVAGEPYPSNPLTKDVLNSSLLLNPIQNANQMGVYITNSMVQVIEYIKARDREIELVLIVLIVIFCCGIPIIYIVSTAIEIHQIEQDKMSIYKCLTALPKNTVSTVSEYLRVLGKDKEHSTTRSSNDTEVDHNKQEENILKVLATCSDSGTGKNLSKTKIIVFTAFTVISMIGAYAALCGIMITNSVKLVREAPHIAYLLGAYTYDAAMVLVCHLVLGEQHGFSSDMVIPNLVTRYHSRLELAQMYYARLLYGEPENKISPFDAFAEGLEDAISRINCQERNTIPVSLYEVYRCFRPDMLYYLHHSMVSSLMHPVEMDDAVIDFNDPMLPEIYDTSLMILYQDLFFPMFSKAVPSLYKSFESSLTPMIGLAYALFCIAMIFEIGIYIVNLQTKKELLYALRLLLHCPPQVVHSCQKIMNTLSGDFSQDKVEAATRNSEFFDIVVKGLPHPCIIYELDGKIVSANIYAMRFFNQSENMNDKSIWDMFPQGSITPRFKDLSSLTKTESLDIILAPDEHSKLYVTLKETPIHGKVVMNITDKTQNVRYNTLISEEREKSDKMLSSILPESLVKRVQQGESNISFAVQSASVMFVDIVEFTPWCGSNTGSFIMSTLNAMFKAFDKELNSFATLTKIKCIGDCYMCAGGIFSEVNQPEVHAGETVEFGLKVIDAVTELNKQINTNLKVRVGVNSGGPIVAGVLGVGKPTFEILGPTINMAQQMEHHGVQMLVHISRTVYELVYGEKFKIKERGTIEIKNGKVQTYLVSGVNK